MINKYSIFLKNFKKKGKIFVNDIINRTVTHAANTDIWKCLLYPKLQQINCSITTQMEEASRRGKSKELVCRPCIKEHKWLKKGVVNKNIPISFKDQKNGALCHINCKTVGKRFSMYPFHGTWFMN